MRMYVHTSVRPSACTRSRAIQGFTMHDRTIHEPAHSHIMCFRSLLNHFSVTCCVAICTINAHTHPLKVPHPVIPLCIEHVPVYMYYIIYSMSCHTMLYCDMCILSYHITIKTVINTMMIIISRSTPYTIMRIQFGVPRILLEGTILHPSIRRIAKQIKTTQNNTRGTRYLIRRMDKPYP